ncbi:hypothetical protein SAMD00019534_097060 [Acytostelium subglobosum LB1]|uniref:hypothetical protein n=1 Tax=Acytostelium subglobosum LB1 TaxID=1410327 RepID=UPI000644EEDE|nr:hypothetical protein SAMD00019534_097060 [Acytostelium subglobosum LB1]GAM26531.1 hypothetical protein SAMD00019534_097060 [Acytostelium subglobosum LB1]|eukprot:XP_012750627.1 hypothetical protein SAMD00019534_097060 [Acytostelium subglobosum LB1]
MRFEEDFLRQTVNGIKAAETYFSDRVAGRSVPWSVHLKSGTITSAENELIERYDKKSEADKRAIFQQDGDRLAQFFVGFLGKITDLDCIQYMLYLVNEIIHIEPKALQSFVKLSTGEPSYTSTIFFRLLGREDNNAYVNLLAGMTLGSILSASNASSKDLEHYVNWSLPLLRKTDVREVEVVLVALQSFLLSDHNRDTFRRLQGTEQLVEIITVQSTSTTPVLTLLYEVLYTFWMITYNQAVANWTNGKDIISKLVHIVKSITKEKITRLAIAALRNLVNHGNNNEEMIECGSIRMLNHLSSKKWGDQDIVDDITYLSEVLSLDVARMSSFDKYKAEVLARELEWSPVHKSEKFWKENALRFEEQSHSVLKFLHLILQKSDNPLHLSVACFDLGEFVRFHPRGKQIVEALGIKKDIMALMTNPNEDVKKNALFALQKMMINNWEYLAKS